MGSMVKQIEEIVKAVESAPPLINGTKLVTIDGPAGSGKTTLAALLQKKLAGAQVVHMDDLYEGWDSTLTPKLSQKIEQLIEKIRTARILSYKPYNWLAKDFDDEIATTAPVVLILEGVGSGQRIIRDVASIRIWISAPKELRLERGLKRDGLHLKDEWLAFQDIEESHFRDQATEAAADYVLSGAPSQQ
jgi:uridine kinase